MEWHNLFANWEIKFVAVALIVAAWIDGKQLKVPNWFTAPMVLSGLIYHSCVGGLGQWNDGGFLGSFVAMWVGFFSLIWIYAMGGMGAGDVKLMAGMGAWLANCSQTWEAFIVSVFVGAVMGLNMAWRSGQLGNHYRQFFVIINEWMTIRDPRELSRIAAERKPTMRLLPYGIPICIGSIMYFLYTGMIVI